MELVTTRLRCSEMALPARVTEEEPAIESTSIPLICLKRASVIPVSVPEMASVSMPDPPRTELVVFKSWEEEVTAKRSPDPLLPSRVMLPV